MPGSYLNIEQITSPFYTIYWYLSLVMYFMQNYIPNKTKVNKTTRFDIAAKKTAATEVISSCNRVVYKSVISMTKSNKSK